MSRCFLVLACVCAMLLAVAARDPICLLPKDSGPCLALFRKWYYNANRGACDEFTYGGCNGNQNRFDSKKACEKKCKRSGSYVPGSDVPGKI